MSTNNSHIPLQKQGHDIAIIGVALRFPKSGSLQDFWDHLIHNRCLIREYPAERRDQGFVEGANHTNKIWGGFIDQPDCFDASFFKISPREAQLMDPQQRMALELAWHAIEDAGYRASAVKSSKQDSLWESAMRIMWN